MNTEESAETPTSNLEKQWLKLQIADHSRMMMDNQATLHEHLARCREDRAFERQQANMAGRTEFGEAWTDVTADAEPGLTDDEMRVLIDSPTTVTHHHAAPPAVAPPSGGTTPTASLASKLAPLLLAAAIGSGGTLAGAWLAAPDAPVPAPAVEDTDTTRRMEIEVVPWPHGGLVEQEQPE